MAFGLIREFNSETGVGILESMSGAEAFAFDVPLPSTLKVDDLVEYQLTQIAVGVRPARTSNGDRMRG
jgi:hypothetical protein